MSDEIEIQKLKEQHPEFFAQFPEEFWDFVLSEETAFKIMKICIKNGIENEERIEKIASRITLILLNQIPKENLTEVLMKGVGLNFDTATQISQEVEKSIFSQVPKLSKKEKPTHPTPPPPSKADFGPSPKVKPETKLEKPKKDIYREPLE